MLSLGVREDIDVWCILSNKQAQEKDVDVWWVSTYYDISVWFHIYLDNTLLCTQLFYEKSVKDTSSSSYSITLNPNILYTQIIYIYIKRFNAT